MIGEFNLFFLLWALAIPLSVLTLGGFFVFDRIRDWRGAKRNREATEAGEGLPEHLLVPGAL